MAVDHDRGMVMAMMHFVGFCERRTQEAERHRDQQYPSKIHDFLRRREMKRESRRQMKRSEIEACRPKQRLKPQNVAVSPRTSPCSCLRLRLSGFNRR